MKHFKIQNVHKKVIENSNQNFPQILLNTLCVKNTVKIWSLYLLPFNIHVQSVNQNHRKKNNKTYDMINIKKVQDAREAIHNLLIYCYTTYPMKMSEKYPQFFFQK